MTCVLSLIPIAPAPRQARDAYWDSIIGASAPLSDSNAHERPLPIADLSQPPKDRSNAGTFDFASDPDFKDYQRVVRRFGQQHRPQAPNHFCLIGAPQVKVRNVWVLWREGAEIILWQGGDDLNRSQRVTHLKSDVVPTENDLHGSTYLVTKSWVDQLFQRCDRFGIKIYNLRGSITFSGQSSIRYIFFNRFLTSGS